MSWDGAGSGGESAKGWVETGKSRVVELGWGEKTRLGTSGPEWSGRWDGLGSRGELGRGESGPGSRGRAGADGLVQGSH
jgi:hypothetical protein